MTAALPPYEDMVASYSSKTASGLNAHHTLEAEVTCMMGATG
jgi:hypothetical protein